jgi:hypothetical protein
MVKFCWLVQCPEHREIDKHFIRKTDAKNYFKWHIKKTGCLAVEEPFLVEVPYLG